MRKRQAEAELTGIRVGTSQANSQSAPAADYLACQTSHASFNRAWSGSVDLQAVRMPGGRMRRSQDCWLRPLSTKKCNPIKPAHIALKRLSKRCFTKTAWIFASCWHWLPCHYRSRPACAASLRRQRLNRCTRRCIAGRPRIQGDKNQRIEHCAEAQIQNRHEKHREVLHDERLSQDLMRDHDGKE